MTGRKIATTLLLACALAGCETVASPEQPPVGPVARADALVGNWHITALDGAALPADRMRLRILPDLSVEGNVVCNRFDGRLEGRLPTLSFANVVMTTSGCEVELSERLARLFAAPATFAIDGSSMTLRTSDGVWRFQRSG